MSDNLGKLFLTLQIKIYVYNIGKYLPVPCVCIMILMNEYDQSSYQGNIKDHSL